MREQNNKQDNIGNFDPLYGKVMHMANEGYSYDQIATAFKISKMRVLDIVQTAFGRSKMFEERRSERRES